jgi:hypothetical protein
VALMTFRTIELQTQGRLEGRRDITLGLRDGALRLGKVSPRVPPRLVKRVRAIERDVASGRIAGIPTTVGD